MRDHKHASNINNMKHTKVIDYSPIHHYPNSVHSNPTAFGNVQSNVPSNFINTHYRDQNYRKNTNDVFKAASTSPKSNITTYDLLKNKLLDKAAFPYTNQQLNLSEFAIDNIQLHKKLIDELYTLKNMRIQISQTYQLQQSKNYDKQRQLLLNKAQSQTQNDHYYQRQKMRVKSVNKIPILTKNKSGALSSIGYTNVNNQNDQISNAASAASALQNLKGRNQFLKQEIRRLKKKDNSKQKVRKQQNINEHPLIKQKKSLIEKKSKDIQSLKSTNLKLKEAQKSGDLFQLYETMCRQCEGLRNANDALSQEMKQVIIKTNKITGNQQNPNLFLMNIK